MLVNLLLLGFPCVPSIIYGKEKICYIKKPNMGRFKSPPPEIKQSQMLCGPYFSCWFSLLSRIRIELDLSTALDDVDSVVQ